MNTTDLSKYNNTWYKPGNSIRRFLWYFFNHLFAKSYIFHIRFLKIFILRLFGAKIGKKVTLKPGINIKYPWFLEIGDNAWIGEKVWIDNLTRVKIGNNVCISQRALLICGNHNYKKSSFDLIVKEIIIENGVWIGANSTVCPGVTCFSHSILTFGSVATKNLEAYGIYSGNPAEKIFGVNVGTGFQFSFP